MRGGANELGVAGCDSAVREQSSVLEAGADPVASSKRALADRPAGNAIAVVHLLERDSCLGVDPLDLGGVRHGAAGVLVERLDEQADAARCQPRGDEPFGVGRCEQPCLDPHTAAEQQLAERDDPCLAIDGGDKVGSAAPETLRSASARGGETRHPRPRAPLGMGEKHRPISHAAITGSVLSRFSHVTDAARGADTICTRR
jgi:hypothetical protein